MECLHLVLHLLGFSTHKWVFIYELEISKVHFWNQFCLVVRSSSAEGCIQCLNNLCCLCHFTIFKKKKRMNMGWHQSKTNRIECGKFIISNGYLSIHLIVQFIIVLGPPCGIIYHKIFQYIFFVSHFILQSTFIIFKYFFL